MKRPVTLTKLYLLPVPKIKRAEILEIVRLRGSIRHECHQLNELGRSVMLRLDKGMEVEPCPVDVEIETLEHGASMVTRLLVDGRPVDDFS